MVCTAAGACHGLSCSGRSSCLVSGWVVWGAYGPTLALDLRASWPPMAQKSFIAAAIVTTSCSVGLSRMPAASRRNWFGTTAPWGSGAKAQGSIRGGPPIADRLVSRSALLDDGGGAPDRSASPIPAASWLLSATPPKTAAVHAAVGGAIVVEEFLWSKADQFFVKENAARRCRSRAGSPASARPRWSRSRSIRCSICGRCASRKTSTPPGFRRRELAAVVFSGSPPAWASSSAWSSGRAMTFLNLSSHQGLYAARLHPYLSWLPQIPSGKNRMTAGYHHRSGAGGIRSPLR